MSNGLKILIAVIVVGIAILIGWLISHNRTLFVLSPTSSPTVVPTSTPLATSLSVTIPLREQSGSQESGTATLTDMNGKTSVTIHLNNAPTIPQPAHIHVGSCPNPGAIKYPLSNVVNGISETTVNVPLTTILSQLPLAINIHKSASQINTFVACGDIVTGSVSGTTPAITMTPKPTVTPSLSPSYMPSMTVTPYGLPTATP